VNAQSSTYLKVLAQAGAIPFLIPLELDPTGLRRLYDLAHGIFLAGGGDIDPDLLQQPAHPTLSDVQPERDSLEFSLSRWAAAEGKPILGVCRGSQVLAVAGGGSLCQDIPSGMPQARLHHYGYIDGRGPGWDELVHEVHLTPTSRLAQILQTDRLWVNSLHHQAVERVAEPMQVTGRSSDGVVEVVERPDHPFYCGVQWHPEILFEQDESSRRIFTAFIAASAAYATAPLQAGAVST
jgi:putative glutamine amidotransferase